eukprot:TRINITY_DN17184_c0_g1_i1.p3 TRINITY_DN17184_c0_g1~~TRINITY_DN17184_c0_g1_i1.p3  ORF type:complete len:142 (+),score=13.78 TRINITY_DN17184_c0_g1_i1:385-810(+)
MMRTSAAAAAHTKMTTWILLDDLVVTSFVFWAEVSAVSGLYWLFVGEGTVALLSASARQTAPQALQDTNLGAAGVGQTVAWQQARFGHIIGRPVPSIKVPPGQTGYAMEQQVAAQVTGKSEEQLLGARAHAESAMQARKAT